ncbi:hypothetical protein BTA51_17790 [Hahella sp. CCB-MM4]|uniref:hypothetical protein n=1 Tax=Hahella sp. (strain CCB-MM4) TaxID=1926491 RepID=UPI000B9ABF81|nr:hypothetical protein [Hahella sp. CCB-MM4]OZG72199.1 hypothetical protein BTA51_17790 [Hahella sp. CCB-MM4]
MILRIALFTTAILFVSSSFLTFADSSSSSTTTTTDSSNAKIVECPVSGKAPDTFALCATATCWTLDGVAYCKCEVMNEESISISFDYEENGKSKNVCDLLLEGVPNGYTVSTYATPRQVETDYDPKVEKLGPPMGYYTCDTRSGTQAYGAQCDGGLCFKSTQGKEFPGLGYIKENEIVCSCPPTLSNSPGFQIAGPWKCKPGDANENNQCCDQSYYNDMCGVTSVKTTGTVLAVNAPIGTARVLSAKLDGKPARFNACRFQ